MDKKTQDKVTVIFTDNPPFNQEGKVENKEAKPEADSLYGGNPAVMADTIEQMANVRKLLKNRLKPVKDAAETFVEINATEKVRLQGSKETKAPSLKPYTEAVDVKDRAELSKLISEARKKNKSFKIGRSMKEGYRYTLLVEADAPQQAKPGDAKVGTHIKIITMTGEPSYTGKVGKITEIDDAGQLHGTWGGLAVIPGDDTFEIVTVVDNESGKVLEKKMEGASEEHHHDEEHKDEGEYDEEGDMAKSDLQIMADAALELHGMLADEENLPEWVQAKITLATDYIDTARDYMKAKKDGLEFPEPKEDEETDTETIVELEPLEEARSKDSIKNEIADLKDKISLIRKGTGDASKRGEINKRLKELQTKLNEAAPGSWGKEVITLQEFATAVEKLGRDDIDVFPILKGIAAGTHRAFVKHEGKDTTITVLRGDVVEMTLTSKKEEAMAPLKELTDNVKEEMEIKDTKFFPGEDGDTEANMFIEEHGIEDFDLRWDDKKGGYVLTWESKEEILESKGKVSMSDVQEIQKELDEMSAGDNDYALGLIQELLSLLGEGDVSTSKVGSGDIGQFQDLVMKTSAQDEEYAVALLHELENIFEVVEEKLQEAKVTNKKELKEEAKIISSLDEYEPWSGAVSTWDKVVEADKVDQLDFLLSDLYPEGMTMTELNDILWFESDWVLGMLGISGDGEGKKEKPKASEKPELEDEELTDEEDFMSMLNDIDDEEPVMVVLDDEDLEESKHKKEKHGKEEMKESSGSVVQEVQSFLKNMMKR